QEMGPANSGTSTLVLNGAGTYSFGGYLRNWNGKLGLTLSGPGTQALVGGQITYTGTTTVSSGTLRLVNTTGFNSPINNSATVEFNTTTNVTLGAGVPISGSGTFVKTGPSILSFNGNQAITASGQINIQQGTYLNNNNNVNWSGNTASIDISSGAILDLFADP